MATYTMPLKAYIERFSQHQSGLSLNEKIEEGRKHLFDFDYPFFDRDEKDKFERDFIMHFYTREIGFETEELFKMKLENWLNINMPYFNQLYESELIDYDPLVNSTTTVKHDKSDTEKQIDGTTTDTQYGETRDTGFTSNEDTKDQYDETSQYNTDHQTQNDDFNRSISSENPDSRLQLQAGKGEGVIEYAGDITERHDDRDETGTETGDSQNESTNDRTRQIGSDESRRTDSDRHKRDDYTSDVDKNQTFLEERFGKIGNVSQAQLLKEYRSTFLRLERDIFREMQELFMLVY